MVNRIQGGEGEKTATTRTALVVSGEGARYATAKEEKILVTLIRPGLRWAGGTMSSDVVQVPGDGVGASFTGELACKGTESFPD